MDTRTKTESDPIPIWPFQRKHGTTSHAYFSNTPPSSSSLTSLRADPVDYKGLPAPSSNRGDTGRGSHRIRGHGVRSYTSHGEHEPSPLEDYAKLSSQHRRGSRGWPPPPSSQDRKNKIKYKPSLRGWLPVGEGSRQHQHNARLDASLRSKPPLPYTPHASSPTTSMCLVPVTRSLDIRIHRIARLRTSGLSSSSGGPLLRESGIAESTSLSRQA